MDPLMKRFLVIYALSALLTTTAYADAYQRLLQAYNDRQPAEILYEQIGKNLSKRVATEAERSNLSFIAIYGAAAQWNKKSLREQIEALVKFSTTQIDDISLSANVKKYRIDHYVHLVVLCVASHVKNNGGTYGDIIAAIQSNIVLIRMHSDVFNRLRLLKEDDLKDIMRPLHQHNFLIAENQQQF